MFRDSKFIWLLLICVLVGILEFLSLGGIHLPLIIEIPLILAIILGVGYKTLWYGLQALFTLNFKSIKALMVIAVVGAFYLGKSDMIALDSSSYVDESTIIGFCTSCGSDVRVRATS